MPAERPARAAYRAFLRFTTRWNDNDVYGHMNNVVFYEYVDSAVNRWMIETGALDVPHSPVVGLVVETRMGYAASVGFPDRLSVGLRAGRIGRSSVTYEFAIFRNDEDLAAAHGHFIHVYVDAQTRRPVEALPDNLRAKLESDLAP